MEGLEDQAQDRDSLVCAMLPPLRALVGHSPQAAFYILQNTKTIALRFRKQCETAQAVAEMLEGHKKVGACLVCGC